MHCSVACPHLFFYHPPGRSHHARSNRYDKDLDSRRAEVRNLKAEAHRRAHEAAVGLRSASSHKLHALEVAHTGPELAAVHTPRWLCNRSTAADRVRWEVVDHSPRDHMGHSHADHHNYSVAAPETQADLCHRHQDAVVVAMILVALLGEANAVQVEVLLEVANDDREAALQGAANVQQEACNRKHLEAAHSLLEDAHSQQEAHSRAEDHIRCKGHGEEALDEEARLVDHCQHEARAVVAAAVAYH